MAIDFDYFAARKAGMLDSEIADFISSKSNFDIGGFRKAGGRDIEAINFLGIVTTPEKPRTFGEAASDTVAGFAKGAGTLTKGAGWLIGSETIQDLGKNAEEYWSSKQSTQLKNSLADVEKAEGFVDSLKAYANNPDALADAIAQSIPSMVPGMGVGAVGARGAAALGMRWGAKAGLEGVALEKVAQKAAERFAIGANMAGEGLVSGGATGADVEANALRNGVDASTAKRLANEAALKTGLWTGAVGAVGAKLETNAMLGQLTDKGVKGFAKNVGKEMLEEGLQNPGEEYFSYEANKQFDPEAKLDIGKAVAGGVLAGGAMGSAFHVAGRLSTKDIATPKDEPDALKDIAEAPDVDTAVDAAVEGARLGLPNYAGPTLVTFPDGSTMTGVEAERYRLDAMRQKMPLPEVATQEEEQRLGLPSYAGPAIHVFPDGSTVTGAEYEQTRLDRMRQPMGEPTALEMAFQAAKEKQSGEPVRTDTSLDTASPEIQSDELSGSPLITQPLADSNGGTTTTAAEIIGSGNEPAIPVRGDLPQLEALAKQERINADRAKLASQLSSKQVQSGISQKQNTIAADKKQPQPLTKVAADRIARQFGDSAVVPHPTKSGMFIVVPADEAANYTQKPSIPMPTTEEVPPVAPANISQERVTETPENVQDDGLPAIDVKQRGKQIKSSKTLLQAIINRGGISRRIMQDVGADPNARYAPGFFTKNGTSDLSELLNDLYNEDGFYQFDTSEEGDGVNDLADEIKRAINGERILNSQGIEEAKAEEEKSAYRDELTKQAKKYGIKSGKKSISKLEAEILKVKAQRLARIASTLR